MFFVSIENGFFIPKPSLTAEKPGPRSRPLTTDSSAQRRALSGVIRANRKFE